MKKNVWIQFIDELEWVETTNPSMCCNYYCEYNLHCLLIGRQQFDYNLCLPYPNDFRDNFFLKTKTYEKYCEQFVLFESVIFCRCWKFETRDITFHNFHL